MYVQKKDTCQKPKKKHTQFHIAYVKTKTDFISLMANEIGGEQ